MLKLLVLLCCFLGSYAEESKKLVVGMELSYPPFETIDKQGNPSGISVEMAYLLGDFLNRPVVIENIPFIGLIPSLKNGRIDLIISSLTVTEQRKQAIDFSLPYLEAGLSLLVNIDSTLTSIEEADKPDRTIVVKQGTTGEVYAQKKLKHAKLLVLDTESACVMEVVQNKADAFIYDQFSIYSQWQRNKKTTKALLKPFYREYWAIGIQKGDDQLKDKVNAFIKDFIKNKTINKLAENYMSEQLKEFEQLGIPLFQ